MTTLPAPPRHRINMKLAAEMGRRIYAEKYRQIYEPEHIGKFLDIDIESGLAGLGDSPEEARVTAKAVAPGGFFYLVRIGFPTAFELH